MTADKFVEIVRKGNDKLRVDEILIQTGNGELHGKGMLNITQDRIEIEVALNADEQAPEMKSGIYTRRDAWKLSGMIEDHLQFRCDYVGPVGNRSWFNERTRITFGLNPIELIPSGFDAMTREERNSYWKSAAEAQGNVLGTPVLEAAEPDSAWFHAVLVEYPLIASGIASQASRGTVFFEEFKDSEDCAYFGELGNFDVGLVKEGNGDLHIYLRTKEGMCPPTSGEDWNKFHALMHALALIHGVNAWPYRIEYWRNAQKITDRVRDAGKLAKTNHAPFTDRLGHQFRGILGKPLEMGVTFFEGGSKLAKEVAQIMFLFRQADSGVHSEITTLAVCALFENLILAIFRELNLEEQDPKNLPMVGDFGAAKKWLCSEIAKVIDDKTGAELEGYSRLLNLVKSARPFTQREICQAVCNHLGIGWKGEMEVSFETWKEARNSLMHARERADQSEEEIRAATFNESRIAGMINIVVLKLMGYSGWANTSTFEDKYRQI